MEPHVLVKLGGAGKMAHRLRKCTALLEDLSSFSLSKLQDSQGTYMHIHRHAQLMPGKAPVHAQE